MIISRRNLRYDVFLLVVGVESGHHAGRQHVVDELEKSFLHHVLIPEQEDRLLVLYAQFEV